MLVVHVAPTLEALATAWTELLIAREPEGGPFSSTSVVVPDPGVAHVLDFALARRRGVAANVRMSTSLDRALGSPRPERGALVGPLVGLLEQVASGPTEPALEPLRRWLALSEGEDGSLAVLGPHALDEARARRRAALALRLARRFEAYAAAPEAEPLASWTAGRAAPSGAGQGEAEAWERALWSRLAPATAPEAQGEGGPLHIVAPAALSPAQASDLTRAAAAREVHAWFVLPDPGGGRAHPVARVASEAVRDAVDRLRPGAALDVVATPPAPSTLLGALQAVLRGEPPPPCAPDGTLEALACADARRAAEVVAQEVGLALRRAERAGEPLRLQEVAVVLAGADPDGDRARLAAAFDAAHRLPIVFSDASPTRELRPVEAARRLLALPTSPLGRREVTELLTHPCVLARLADEEAPGVLAASFEGWLEAAGVVRGLDATDQAGTYLAAPGPGEAAPPALHTWDQGLLRLALAAFVDPASGGEALGVLPAPLGPGARVERLVALGRSLLADARAVRDLRLPLAEWADLLGRWVSGLVGGTDEGERGALERALAALRGLAWSGEAASEGAPVAVPWGVARALADEALARLRPRRDHDLTGGVVVGGLQALRGAPFRVVLLLGLAEGAFPAVEPHDPLDLRPGPVPWDPGPRARDQAALVERVLATTERLAVVWAARDPLTNEEVPWSPAVAALVRAALDAGLVPSADALVRRPAARREEEQDAPLAPAAGRREARARALRDDLDRHLAAHGLEGAALDDARLPALEAALASAGAPGDPPPAAEAPRVRAGHVTLAALHDLLESPLQAWARAGLRLWRDEEGDGGEPFAPTRLDEVVWLRDAFVSAVTGSRAGDPRFERALALAWDRLADGARRSGRGPTGPFLAAARTRALRALGAWRDALDASPGLAHLRGVRGVRFGAVGGPPPGALPEEARPPLALALPGGETVQLVGRTGPLLPDGQPLLLVDGRQATDAQLARAALDLAALEAAGLLATDEPHRLRVVPSKGPARTLRLRPFGRHAALDWLAALAADLRQPHPYALPLGPAARWLRRAGPGGGDGEGGAPLVTLLRLGRESRHTPWDDDHGPLPRPRRAAPPPDAEALARRRLGPWLGREVGRE